MVKTCTRVSGYVSMRIRKVASRSRNLAPIPSVFFRTNICFMNIYISGDWRRTPGIKINKNLS